MASVSAPPKPTSTPALQTMAVQSTFIAAVEYDQANLTLTTHLRSGAVYQHKFVLPGEWVKMQTAQDPSKHWSNSFPRKHPSVRVKSAKAPNSEKRKRSRK